MSRSRNERIVRRFLAGSQKAYREQSEAAPTDIAEAKGALKAKLGRSTWLRGVGIGGGPGQYSLKVNVAALTPEVRKNVPNSIEGVPVRIEPVGEIRAR